MRPNNSSLPTTPVQSDASLDAKLNRIRESIVEQLTGVITASEGRVMKRIDEMSAKLEVSKSELKKVVKRVAAVELTCAEFVSLNEEVGVLKATVESGNFRTAN